jgi:hypothetical protein
VRYVCQSVFPYSDSWEDGTFSSNVNIGVDSSAPASVLLHAFVQNSTVAKPVVKIELGDSFWTAVSHFIYEGDRGTSLDGLDVDYSEFLFNSSTFEQKNNQPVYLSLQTTHLATSVMTSQTDYVTFIEGGTSGYLKWCEFQADKEYIFAGAMPTSLMQELPSNSEVLGAGFVYAGNLILTLHNITTKNDAVNKADETPSFMIWTAGGATVVNEPKSVKVQASPGLNSSIGLVNCLRPLTGTYSVVENKFQMTVEMDKASAEALLDIDATELRLYLRTPVGYFNSSSIPNNPPQGFNEYSLAIPNSKVFVEVLQWGFPVQGKVQDASLVHPIKDRPPTPGTTLYEQTLVVDLNISPALQETVREALEYSSSVTLKYVFPEGKYSYIEAASPGEKGRAEYLNETFTSTFQLKKGNSGQFFSMF